MKRLASIMAGWAVTTFILTVLFFAFLGVLLGVGICALIYALFGGR